MRLFGDRIREYRAQNGLTQGELAEKLFVSRQAVSKWEQGRGFPSTAILESISNLLNVTIDELIRSEEDDKLVIETATTFGWRLKSHLFWKILMLIAPFLVCLISLQIFISFTYDSLILSNFENLEAYQAYLLSVGNYIDSAHFIILIALIPAVLNVILYSLTVAGILKPRFLRLSLLCLNVFILITTLISAVIVCVMEGIFAVGLGLLGGWFMYLLAAAGVMVFFFFSATMAEKEMVTMPKIKLAQLPHDKLKKLPLFFYPAAFYVLYMVIYLTVSYFSTDDSYKRNILSSFGGMATVVGLMIIVPIIISACLYLLLIMKKTHLSTFISLIVLINLPMLFISLFYSLVVMGVAGNGSYGEFFGIGAILTIAFYITTLIIIFNSSRHS